MSDTKSQNSHISHASGAATHYNDELPAPIRSPDKISDSLKAKRRYLKRAWAVVLAPSRDGTIGGRRRDNRTLALSMVQKFTDEIEELEDELYKSRCFEWWLEDVAERAGSWCEKGEWGDEGGERDVVWEEAGEEERKEKEMAERIAARCRWDT